MKSIIIDDLCFDYEENTPTIQHVTFAIEQGAYVAILGHNGSGKSTIAKLTIGLLEKKSGQIVVHGIPLEEKTLYDVRSHVGIVFQNPDNQFIGATVRDDIAFGLENKCVPPQEMEAIIQQYAREVGMIDFLDHEPSKLSGGQKQRVAIAGILAMQPDILILDESTSMLDPKGKREINELVRKIRANTQMTVISITHDIEEAVLADQVILLNQGKVEKMGTPEEVLVDMDCLNRLGLQAPFTYQLVTALNDAGIKVKKQFDQDKLVEELWQLRLKK